MRLEVHFTPHGIAPGELKGIPVIVVDVLRAATSIAAALAAGAKAIYPAATTEDALRLKRDLGGEDVLLAGERRTLPVPGFDLGNSPREMTPERVGGRRMVLATTNGTPAIARAAGGASVLIGAAVNFSAVVAAARDLLMHERRLAIVCAGRDGRFAAEDGYAAGRLVLALKHRRRNVEFDDGALAAAAVAERWGKDWLAVLERSEAGAVLRAAGMEEDVGAAALQDAHAVVPRMVEGVIR